MTNTNKTANTTFGVAAGKYEDDNGMLVENCKYSDDFDSLEKAIEAYETCKTYPWARIEMRNGEFIYEINPTRIQVREPTTGYFSPCDSNGSLLSPVPAKPDLDSLLERMHESGTNAHLIAALRLRLKALPEDVLNETMFINGKTIYCTEMTIDELVTWPLAKLRKDLRTAAMNLDA